MKLISIAGARPQFIKLAALSREIRLHPGIQEIILHTGQHWEDQMSGIFFRELDIPEPVYQLGIHELSHGAMTGRMLEAIESVLKEVGPDMVLVYGDTNSTLAGALAAKKLQIPLAHVEAGLRNYDLRLPEEINRVVTDRISDLLFCPTAGAVDNLDREGFRYLQAAIYQTGDLMWDALTYYDHTMNARTPVSQSESPYVLCTVHREENIQDLEKLKDILSALGEIHHVIPLVFPVHPRTDKAISTLGIELSFGILPPIGWLEMIGKVKHCQMVITDSGGLQKEAYFFHKPCITLRDKTEWTELVDCGCNIPTGSDRQKIQQAFHTFLNKKINFDADFYGDGKAAERMISHILDFPGR